MSQYPPGQYPPSQYPPGYPSPYPIHSYATPAPMDPGAHGRRACIMMIIVGVIGLLMAGCVGVTAAMISGMAEMPELKQSLQQIEQQAGVNARTLLTIAAVVFGGVAVVQIILGIVVRGGGMVAGVLGIVFTSILILYSIVNVVASIGMGGQLGAACLSAGMVVVFGVQLFLLINVCRNAGHVAWMKQMTALPQQPWQAPMMPHPAPPGAAAPPGAWGGYGYGYGNPPAQAPTSPAPGVYPQPGP
ncbi:MAG TPA: hypothetical protein PLD59_04070, partial [Tepidisphaeraceae bacterium]|nr:hypothetical protein [Tepidisphaeraceae bacterium]